MSPVNAYITHCEARNLRPNFLYHQRLLLERVGRHLGHSVLDASTEELEDYLGSRPLAQSSRRAEISNLRSFYGWAVRNDLLDRDPTARIVKPRIPPTLPRPMPADDVARALAEAPCDVAPILNLAVYAGLRAAEIAQLRAEDLSEHPGMILIRESKGGGESVVPFSPTLASILERCPLPSSGWLFPAQRGDGHLSRVRICQIANRYLHSLGIPDTLHSLRHAYGTALYRQTHDLRLTQELMRHRSIQSTVGYTLVDPGDGADAVGRLQW